jgi:hypothetical protein
MRNHGWYSIHRVSQPCMVSAGDSRRVYQARGIERVEIHNLSAGVFHIGLVRGRTSTARREFATLIVAGYEKEVRLRGLRAGGRPFAAPKGMLSKRTNQFPMSF